MSQPMIILIQLSKFNCICFKLWYIPLIQFRIRLLLILIASFQEFHQKKVKSKIDSCKKSLNFNRDKNYRTKHRTPKKAMINAYDFFDLLNTLSKFTQLTE